jgi:cell division protein FtsN
MVDRGGESGRELVLDNRKLIGVFAVLVAICVVIFVLGFIEGKRQGKHEGAQIAAESARTADFGGTQAQTSKPADANTGASLPKEDSAEQQLNWYKNVNRKGEASEITPQTTADGPAGETKDSDRSTKTAKEPVPEQKKDSAPEFAGAPKPQKQGAVTPSDPVAYSVQVGAFRLKSEVETKAQELREKGYDCRIEDPQSSEDLYLLKVGKYASRAEAIAMQLRLKKSGFFSFVKTN